MDRQAEHKENIIRTVQSTRNRPWQARRRAKSRADADRVEARQTKPSRLAVATRERLRALIVANEFLEPSWKNYMPMCRRGTRAAITTEDSRPTPDD
jgi:hypothetical protein